MAQPLPVIGQVDWGDELNAVLAELQAVAALARSGTGSPEGVVTAPAGTAYTDTAATNGAVKWIKSTAAGATGWKVVYGDTGWRKNDPAVSWFLNGATPGADLDTGTRFRRVGNSVQLILGLTTPAGWVNGTDFLTVPLGFRAQWLTYMSAGYANTHSIISVTNVMKFYSGTVNSARYHWTWMTDEPWPTTLPGVAG